MSDLFHKEIPTAFIDSVFDTMEAASWHTFQVLTKRSPILARYLKYRYGGGRAPSHIWLGVSVEDAKNAVRLRHLRDAPASVKFVSFEPLLGPVGKLDLTGINWAIVGGESGPGARPMAEEWALEIRDQCKSAKVAFFFKQWGGIRPKAGGRTLRGREWSQYPDVSTRRSELQATETDDFRDTSFMIAIEVSQDAQRRMMERIGIRRKINCFFSESDRKTYEALTQTVSPHHRPADRFEIETYSGTFESAIPKIHRLIGASFPLIFIDPTGWTGFGFHNVRSIFQSAKCEVLINYMYDHITRFVASPDETTITSLEPIIGGAGWQDRLDKSMPLGLAAEKLFLETLKVAGGFSYVISTKIDKSTADRPHFCLAYGTKSREGLKAFRQIQFDALKSHAGNRARAKAKRAEDRSNIGDLFVDHEAEVREASIDDMVSAEMERAGVDLLGALSP